MFEKFFFSNTKRAAYHYTEKERGWFIFGTIERLFILIIELSFFNALSYLAVVTYS